MKTFLPVFLLILKLTTAYGQSPGWQWAKGAGGTNLDGGRNVCTDKNGNIFLSGFFRSSSITFDSITLTGSPGKEIAFLVKYDPNGNVLWAKIPEEYNKNVSYIGGLTADAKGNVFITGSHADSTGKPAMFIFKYDPAGTKLWSKNSVGHAFGKSVNIDINDNVYVAGGFNDSAVTFGSTTFLNSYSVYPYYLNTDLFLVKYNSSGNVLWAKSANGNKNSGVNNCVKTDVDGNIFVTGGFSGASITFDSVTLTNPDTNNFGSIFTIKYDNAGHVIWARSPVGNGGSLSSHGHSSNSLDTDGDGNIYVAGYFQDSALTFGTHTLLNSEENGSTDIFLAKYSALGDALWVKGIGEPGGDTPEFGISVVTDKSGNVIISSSFDSTLTFGATTLKNESSFSGYNIFVANYNTDGNPLWAKSASNDSGCTGWGLCTDSNNNIFVTGYFFSSTITFDQTVLNNSGYYNVFLAKLDHTTGIHKESSTNPISIYPNPFCQQTILQTDKPLQNATLTIYNCFGQAAKELKNLSGYNITIFRDDLLSGFYLVQLKEGNKIIATSKFVITDQK